METKILEKKLIEIRDLLLELEALKTDIQFISNKEEYYFKNIIENSPFFYRVYRNSIKLFVIDICKLLNSNEHYSLPKTIDYLISNRKIIPWKREVQIARLRELKGQIGRLNLDQLENFKILGNKHYVHNDENKHKFESKVSLTNCWKTLEIIQKVFNELNLGISNQQYIFEMLAEEPLEIIAVSHYKDIKKYVLAELRESRDIGKLQGVRNITLGKKPTGNM